MKNCFKGCIDNYNDANIVIYGVPFDGTVCFKPGARFALNEIRLESYGLETYSPFFKEDLTQKKIYDDFDIDIPYGNTEKVLNMVYNKTKEIYTSNKIPFMLGEST